MKRNGRDKPGHDKARVSIEVGRSCRDADAPGAALEAAPPNSWPLLMRLQAGGAGTVALAEQASATAPLLRRVLERVPDQRVSRFVGESFAPSCVGQAVFNF